MALFGSAPGLCIQEKDGCMIGEKQKIDVFDVHFISATLSLKHK